MKNWSSKSVGSKFQQNIFYYLIKFFGYIPAYALLYVVIFWYSVAPYTRKRASFYLRKRFPDYDKSFLRAFIHTYRLYINFGKVLLDRAIMGVTGKSSTESRPDDTQKIAQLLNENNGLIILTAHTGFGETNMTILNYIEKPTYIVLYFDEGDVDKHYFDYGSAKKPFEIINSNSFLGGAIEITAALENHGAVCMMGDRSVGGASSISVNFLGEKADFLISHFKYAASLDVKIAVCFSVRTGICQSIIYVAGVIDMAGSKGRKAIDFANEARQFSKLLEEFTEKYPYQFFNFYNMWSKGEGND